MILLQCDIVCALCGNLKKVLDKKNKLALKGQTSQGPYYSDLLVPRG